MIVHKSVKDADTQTEYRLAMGKVDFFVLRDAVRFAKQVLVDGGDTSKDTQDVMILLTALDLEMEHPEIR
jgi:hypothetical protein